MKIAIGNAGWLQIREHPDLRGVLYVRLAENSAGCWRAVEVYVDGRGEMPLSDFDALPGLIERVEASAAVPDVRESLASRAGVAGPPVSVLASYFATTFAGRSAGGWVADAYWSQFPDSGVPAVKHVRRRRATFSDAPPPLDPPDDGPITDEFLRQVARAYWAAIARGEMPAVAMTEQLEATGHHRSIHAVRKWIYTARVRGIMPPGQQGKVG